MEGQPKIVKQHRSRLRQDMKVQNKVTNKSSPTHLTETTVFVLLILIVAPPLSAHQILPCRPRSSYRIEEDAAAAGARRGRRQTASAAGAAAVPELGGGAGGPVPPRPGGGRRCGHGGGGASPARAGARGRARRAGRQVPGAGARRGDLRGAGSRGPRRLPPPRARRHQCRRRLSVDTADYAVGLVVAVLRRVAAAEAHVRRGAWASEGKYPLATKVSGKRVGILGLGSIGTLVARRLAAFGCRIAYTSRAPKPSCPYEFFPTARALAAASDVLVLSCALTEETRRVVDWGVMEALGAGGVLVNVGRGGLVDEPELVRCLREGVIGGAGLDVYERTSRTCRRSCSPWTTSCCRATGPCSLCGVHARGGGGRRGKPRGLLRRQAAAQPRDAVNSGPHAWRIPQLVATAECHRSNFNPSGMDIIINCPSRTPSRAGKSPG
ncbi:unnamed protein product [Miscanthus lutarioriparius]|uniref:D-isomer specific 2-hydroxyacid dehydrogenase NAD-binding domain-containing protein n=1 Tax=Miscanthus lutarioriparius TaxID=422564 RepID=A0A811NU18_9POAL|nr:unnamed protein product [Miscanthus lutarioriparius]